MTPFSDSLNEVLASTANAQIKCRGFTLLIRSGSLSRSQFENAKRRKFCLIRQWSTLHAPTYTSLGSFEIAAAYYAREQQSTGRALGKEACHARIVTPRSARSKWPALRPSAFPGLTTGESNGGLQLSSWRVIGHRLSRGMIRRFRGRSYAATL
jgi:hypothetical protein